MRVGIDLDGVLVGGPPFVPSWLLELLYRGPKDKKLHYRIPDSQAEIWIRRLSHNPFFRPPISKNIEKLKNMNKDELFLVTSRFSFLQDKTKNLLQFYGLNKYFKDIVLNLGNEQPHIFKQKTIEKLKLDVFIDDDKDLVSFLKKELPKVKFLTSLSK